MIPPEVGRWADPLAIRGSFCRVGTSASTPLTEKLMPAPSLQMYRSGPPSDYSHVKRI